MSDFVKREDAMTVALQLGLNKWKPQFIKRKVMEIPSAIEPCEDAISRESAIEIAYAYCPDDDGSCTKGDRDIRELLDDLEALPSVAPSRPSGEWICHEGRWIDFDYYPTKYECNQCHHYVSVASDKNFCPNCGAKMSKEADDE